MPKETENPENIDIDTNYDESFEEQSLFSNPRARFKAHGLIESSEESEVNRDDDLQPSATTSGKQKAKPGIDEIGIFEFFITGVPNPAGLEVIDKEKLLKIQKNIQATLKERDAERDRNITNRMKEYEQKYDIKQSLIRKCSTHVRADPWKSPQDCSQGEIS